MFFTAEDTHSPCVVCFRARRVSARGSWLLTLWAFVTVYACSQRALFEEGSFTSVPRCAGPAFAEAERWLCSWESQMDQVEDMKTGEPLSSSFPIRSSARSLWSEARPVVSSPQREGLTLRLSSSEEVDLKDVDKLCKVALFAQAYYERGGCLCFSPTYDHAVLVSPLLRHGGEWDLQRLVPLVGTWWCGSPCQACLAGSGSTSLLPRRWHRSEDSRFNRRLWLRQSWCPWPRTYEGRPHWGRALYTAAYGARLFSVPSGHHLPTLSRSVFQDAAISSEHTSQFLPPGNVAELGCSPLLRESDYTWGQFRVTGSLSMGFVRFALGEKHINIGSWNGHCKRCRPPLAAESFQGLRLLELYWDSMWVVGPTWVSSQNPRPPLGSKESFCWGLRSPELR